MSSLAQKFNAIILDSVPDARIRLKQATASVLQFGKVVQTTNMEEALSQLNREDHYDVVFISHRLGHATIAETIKAAKVAPGGQDAAFVLVLKSQDQQSDVVASNVILGADGFLFEPYSVDALVEITDLSAKVRLERIRSREEAAFRFLLNDILNQVDMLAYLKKSEMEVGTHARRLREMCSVFEMLEGDRLELYLSVAVDAFENAPLPKKIFQRRAYSGVSKRVKKKADDRVLREIEGATLPPGSQE